MEARKDRSDSGLRIRRALVGFLLILLEGPPIGAIALFFFPLLLASGGLIFWPLPILYILLAFYVARRMEPEWMGRLKRLVLHLFLPFYLVRDIRELFDKDDAQGQGPVPATAPEQSLRMLPVLLIMTAALIGSVAMCFALNFRIPFVCWAAFMALVLYGWALLPVTIASTFTAWRIWHQGHVTSRFLCVVAVTASMTGTLVVAFAVGVTTKDLGNELETVVMNGIAGLGACLVLRLQLRSLGLLKDGTRAPEQDRKP